MSEDIIVSPVDGRKISLAGMSRRQLRDLHYSEEVEMTQKILKMPPFSEERKKMLNEGYAFVETLKLRYEKVGEIKSFGATSGTVRIVSDIVKDRLEQSSNEQTIYEAGVGLGFAVKELAKLPNVKYFGCDVTLLPETAELGSQYENVFIHENTLYEDLQQMEDDSIDVFYADNVIEHLIPDEADEIFKILHKKMKKKGVLVLIIPNRYTGPHDVTQYYLKKGERAKGFHFMEMTYAETIRFARRHGFKANYIYKDSRVRKDTFGIQNFERRLTEHFISKCQSTAARMELMKIDTFGIYILNR